MQEWDSSASDYDLFEKKWHHYRNVAQRLLKLLTLREDSRILELACGTGACTQLLAETRSKGKILAVDLSWQMLLKARENLRNSGVADFIEASAAFLPLYPVTNHLYFDIAVCNAAFWQFDNALKVLRDIRSILADDGQFGFTVPLWFSSDEDREQFRKEVREIYAKYKIEQNLARTGRRPFNYAELFEKANVEITREENFEVEMTAEARQEWRAIPIFRRSNDVRSTFTETLPEEMRRELAEARHRAFPDDSGKVRWRAIVAVPK